jgi:hypothetical protein
MLTADYLFLFALAFVAACSLWFAPRIRSDRIAMQWGFDGKPTWYAPKQIGIWAVPAVMLVVRLFIWAAMTWLPARVHWPEFGIALLSVIAAGVHVFILTRAAKAS